MTDFHTLQKRIVQGDHFEKCCGTAEFSEDKHSMFLNMTLPKEAWCVKKLDTKFQSLKHGLRKNDCADAVIWMPTDSGQWVLHIIEMKKTVTRSSNNTSWEHIKSQFVGAYRICRMVAAALDIEIEQVVFYTAFVNDNLSDTDDTEDPVIFLPDREMPDDIAFPQIEWASGKCRLGDSGWSDNYTDKEHIHIGIQLKESDDGTYTLTCPCHQI